jgi:glycosyltransferase involved in cell wall biosynthesis
MMGGPEAWPKIGVVIPVFGHSRLVAEAIETALAQAYEGDIEIVIVVDGDPNAETVDTVRAFLGSGRRVAAIYRKNGRLPAARNTGIRYLLWRHPDLFAVFFLDADNRLSEHSIGAFTSALLAHPEAVWAYPDVSFFGLNWGYSGFDIRETAPVYSRLRHLMGNICEAGSMVRASVVREGTMFDESFKFGYEDWEFWLQCLHKGYLGTRVPNAGFLYRRRADSMLADADRVSSDIRSMIRRKHADLFSAGNVGAMFEEEMAPILYVGDGEDRFLMSTAGHARRIGLDELGDLLRQGFYRYHQTYLPRFLILALGATSAPPPIESRDLERLFRRFGPDDPFHLDGQAQLLDGPGEAACYLVIDFGKILIDGEAPPDTEHARLEPILSLVRQIHRAPKTAHAARRYSGPPAFRIDEFMRRAGEEADRPVRPVASDNRDRCLILHGGDEMAAKTVAAELAEYYRTTMMSNAQLLDSTASRMHESRYAGSTLVYRDDGGRFPVMSMLMRAFDAAYFVNDTSNLFPAGQLKENARFLSLVFSRAMTPVERSVTLAVEHSLNVVICPESEKTKLSALGIPARKLETMAEHLLKLQDRAAPRQEAPPAPAAVPTATSTMRQARDILSLFSNPGSKS